MQYRVNARSEKEREIIPQINISNIVEYSHVALFPAAGDAHCHVVVNDLYVAEEVGAGEEDSHQDSLVLPPCLPVRLAVPLGRRRRRSQVQPVAVETSPVLVDQGGGAGGEVVELELSGWVLADPGERVGDGEGPAYTHTTAHLPSALLVLREGTGYWR